MNKRQMLKVITLGLACTVALGSVSYSQHVEARKQNPGNHAKNVILMIGDGMGPTQVSAAAYMKRKGYGAGKLTMSRLQETGLATTYSHDSVVTDSSAAATAFSSGYKTDNGVVGKAPKHKEHYEGERHDDVKTVLDDAQKKRKATGLVTTTRLTHATPASFASHVEDRDSENEIADQMMNHGVDVLLGGGKANFLPKKDGGKREDGKNLIQVAEKKGYTVVEDKESLKKAKSNKLLGLFNNSHLNYELDRATSDEPSVADMTRKALKTLSKDKNGFFLMVEGGRIDHAGHDNYPAANIRDTLAFDKAVRAALNYAKKDPDTLVVVTADHETGGMSMGANGTYVFNKEVIDKVKRSSEFIGKEVDKDRSKVKEIMAKYAGINDLKPEEEQSIQKAKDPASAVAKVISDRANVGWTSTAHTAVNVPIFSQGPRADQLSGTIDNTKIAKVISRAMK
ncbi:alkaline phosphatase [Salinithrix halophila]|uniref:Alkaline phosphatase n=1 Tax=Salinithrix halophila TaxID=1485204 RepID=A0ABV8JGP9_9BACL